MEKGATGCLAKWQRVTMPMLDIGQVFELLPNQLKSPSTS